jgi:hypothetical protein
MVSATKIFTQIKYCDIFCSSASTFVNQKDILYRISYIKVFHIPFLWTNLIFLIEPAILFLSFLL